MCGRFTLHLADLRQLKKLLRVQRILIAQWEPRYNVAPTQDVPVVLGSADRSLEALRWGLVPHWSKSSSGAARNINARVESIAQKPTFREAFRRTRCIVPATGYFEWQKSEGTRRAQPKPIWIHPRDGGVLALAGVSDSWRSPAGQMLRTFAIVTTEARGALRDVHTRMPLELRGDDADAWLHSTALTPEELATLVRHADDTDHLALRAVDSRVNSPAFDDPGCIASPEPSLAAVEASAQLDLFDPK